MDFEDFNISNFDETLLLIKGFQNRSQITRDDIRKWMKFEQTGITSQMGVSMTSQLLKTLLIWKNAQPRMLMGFNMSLFNLKYTSNTKGWITLTECVEYYHDLNNDFINIKRKISDQLVFLLQGKKTNLF